MMALSSLSIPPCAAECGSEGRACSHAISARKFAGFEARGSVCSALRLGPCTEVRRHLLSVLPISQEAAIPYTGCVHTTQNIAWRVCPCSCTASTAGFSDAQQASGQAFRFGSYQTVLHTANAITAKATKYIATTGTESGCGNGCEVIDSLRTLLLC